MDFEDEQLKAALATLPMRERQAMQMKVEGRTLEQIAMRLKVSRSTAGRLLQSASWKLEAKLKSAARADKWRNVLAGGKALDTGHADDGAEPDSSD